MLRQLSERTIRSDYEAVIAEFIRTKGITRCPTACVLPTQGSIDAGSKSMPSHRSGCAKRKLRHAPGCSGMSRSRRGRNRRRLQRDRDKGWESIRHSGELGRYVQRSVGVDADSGARPPHPRGAPGLKLGAKRLGRAV